MKILATGDWHYRPTRPRGRLDDYIRTQQGKIAQIGRLMEEEGCIFLLQPGDFFDNPTPPMWLLAKAIRNHCGWDVPTILAVLGQHDQRYHSTEVDNTPLAVLREAGAVRILGPEPYVFGDVEFYGASWNGDIPDPPDNDRVKVLVMHRMVIGDRKLWSQQTGFMWSRNVLNRHPFDLIVTGDNHTFFIDRVPGRFLVNCGSLMRSNIDQAHHKPSVVVYDTKQRTICTIPLTVEPASVVLDLEMAEASTARNAELEAFIEQVGQNRGAPDLDFLKTLHHLTREKDVPKGVAGKVDKIVGMSDAG